MTKKRLILGLFFAVFIVLFIISCGKNDSLEAGALPALSTTSISNITSYGATVTGNVTSDEGSAILSRGICYGDGYHPTLDGGAGVVPAGTGTGSFTCKITGLSNNITYYARAYATNSGGTNYGEQIIFKTAIAMGQDYQGGIVFFLDSTSHNIHGYVAAPADQDSNLVWGCTGTSIPGAEQLAVGKGLQNTIDIIDSCNATDNAAHAAQDLLLGGYNDWFLPSYEELKLLYKQRNVAGVGNGYYWSSSEYDANTAHRMHFTDGFIGPVSKSSTGNVRAIRKF